MLTVILRRRYDTKSTIMKIMFILTLFSYSACSNSIYLYQPVFTIQLILIAIVNTSNIYLNREERIKLLNA
ncbi:hypothetical protein D3C73_1242650 [compost metagenome]